MTVKRLDKLLQEGSGKPLEKLIQHAQNMDSLAARLRAVLPADLAAELSAANLRDDGELVVVCTSSAWASRLRFESECLLAVAAEGGEAVTHCRVVVSDGNG